MKWVVAGKTDKGCVRQNNEDSLAVDDALGLFIVADGMGGAASGEVASRLAVDVIAKSVREAVSHKDAPLVGHADSRFSPQANRLASSIRLSNQLIYETARARPQDQGMGTTVVSVWMSEHSFVVAHVGDSRIYLVRKGVLQRLTEDHSLVAEQVKKGLLTEEQAEASGIANIITRALGTEPSVEVDLDEVAASEGDCVILCSDGLTKMLDDAQILKAAQEAPEPEALCEQLVSLALAAGGKDNVTVVAARLVDEPRVGLWDRFNRFCKGRKNNAKTSS